MPGLEIEPMLVQPDSAGKVYIVVSNPSSEVMGLHRGQCVGSAQVCEEYAPGTSDVDMLMHVLMCAL